LTDGAVKKFDAVEHDAGDKAAHETLDERLIASAAAGDEKAFEELFNRYRLKVARAAGRFFRERAQIEEIVQETFTKIYFALPDYRGASEKSFVSWLLSIAFNACYDELRRRKRRFEIAESDLSEDEAKFLYATLRDESRAADIEHLAVSRDLAHKLLAHLDADDRLILTLLNGEELSAAEAAKITGWSVAKVKVRAHRARIALRRIIRNLSDKGGYKS
jgi:RNA polymerase sigma-70 factor (ECF subfamily)